MKLKKTFLYGFSILSLACLSSAQDAPKGPPPEGGPPGGGRPPGGPPGGGDPAARIADFIKRADTNADGKIDKEEFAVLGKKENETRFDGMDANKDGLIDADEVGKLAQRMRQGGQNGMRRPEGGGPPGGEGGFRRPPGGEGGSPGGTRSRGEGGGRSMFGDPKENFKRMDADGNGSISEDEYLKATEKMREMMRSRGGMGRPGEGGSPGGAGGFRRPPTEGDAPKAPAAPAPAPAADKPKE